MAFKTEDPQVRLQFVKRDGRFILQQLWSLTSWNNHGRPSGVETEWRDVPLVELEAPREPTAPAG